MPEITVPPPPTSTLTAAAEVSESEAAAPFEPCLGGVCEYLAELPESGTLVRILDESADYTGSSISTLFIEPSCSILHVMDKTYRISQFGARVGRTAKQLRDLDTRGVFPAKRTITGQRYYTEADALRFLGLSDEAANGLTVVYCRVSRRGQQADLQRQVQAMETYCLGAGVAVDEWLSEIGGGLNFKRQGFLRLMERIENREIVHLLLAHRDRLTRFGFDWFEHFARQHGCTFTVVNQESLSPQAEMVEDLMAIVHAFSGRLSGLRSYRKQIREAAGDG